MLLFVQELGLTISLSQMSRVVQVPRKNNIRLPLQLRRLQDYRNYVRNPQHSVGHHITHMIEMWTSVRGGVSEWEASFRLMNTLPPEWYPYATHVFGQYSEIHGTTFQYEVDFLNFASHIYHRWATSSTPPAAFGAAAAVIGPAYAPPPAPNPEPAQLEPAHQDDDDDSSEPEEEAMVEGIGSSAAV